MIRRLACSIAGLLAGFLLSTAQAQVSCPNTTKRISTNTYTLANSDLCQWLIFTTPGSLTVNLPAPNLTFLPPTGGYKVAILPYSNQPTVQLLPQPDATGRQPLVNGQLSASFIQAVSIELRVGDDSNWYAIGTSNGSAQPAGPIGAIQYNTGNGLGGYPLGPTLSASGGVIDVGNGLVTAAKFSAGAVCFSLGPWTGDLSGAACSAPSLAVGSASRNVGNLGNGLTGTLPNPGLNASAVSAAIGAPAGDVTGTSYTATVVSGLQGTPIDPTKPTAQTALVFNGSMYTPQPYIAGISQLGGTGSQLQAGPGSGVQPGFIVPNTVTNQQLVNAPAVSLKGNPAAVAAVPMDIPVSGGLAFVNNALQLSPTLGASVSQTVSDGTNKFCLIITNGTVTTVTSGACTTGTINLTADDGATLLTADDALTNLTADGATVAAACNSGKVAFNVTCNATFFSLFRSVF